MRRFQRLVVRLVLLLCGIAALSCMAAAFYFKGSEAIETWLVVSASLAVITSLASAWSSQVTREMQEEQLRPEITIYIDPYSRYQFLLLKMKNTGRVSAFNIEDEWADSIINWRGNGIRFSVEEPVSALHPDQELSLSIDVPHTYFERYKGEKYDGVVKFKDAAGRRYEQKFLVDPGQYRHGVLHDQELVKTLFELQKIPSELEKIRAEAAKMRNLITRTGPAIASDSSPADDSSAQSWRHP